MGGCHAKSALGVDDLPAEKKPHKPHKTKSFLYQKKRSGSLKQPKAQTYPVDVPVSESKSDEEDCGELPKGNGHVISQPFSQGTETDLPSYGTDVSPAESPDPDSPQPHDQESSPSCDPESSTSPEVESPLSEHPKTIPASDSGIYSLCQSSHETTPTANSAPITDILAHRTAIEEAKCQFLETSTPKVTLVPTSYLPTVSASAGSLDNICEEETKISTPENVPVKRFNSHQGLPPLRPQSESRFSFKRFKKRKNKNVEKSNSSRGSWKSQDSFDLNSMLKTGLSRTTSECSDMCLCEELYSIQAPLAQFDSILTMDVLSCGSLNKLPLTDSQTDQLSCSFHVCKEHSQLRQDSSITRATAEELDEHVSRLDQVVDQDSTDRPSSPGLYEDGEGLTTIYLEGKEMIALDPETYNQLLSDLALVRIKLQRIYNLLLQEEFDSISDIINNSGLEECLVEC